MKFHPGAGCAAPMAESLAPDAHSSDSESDRFMDSDDARDYADQFQLPGSPGSPGGISDENQDILAAVLKAIPECISEADFACFAYLLPYMESVHVETRTVQQAIAVSHYAV